MILLYVLYIVLVFLYESILLYYLTDSDVTPPIYQVVTVYPLRR